MAADVAIFVSKRLQRAVIAVMCLMTLQAALAYASRAAEPQAGPQTAIVRVHIGG